MEPPRARLLYTTRCCPFGISCRKRRQIILPLHWLTVCRWFIGLQSFWESCRQPRRAQLNVAGASGMSVYLVDQLTRSHQARVRPRWDFVFHEEPVRVSHCVLRDGVGYQWIHPCEKLRVAVHRQRERWSLRHFATVCTTMPCELFLGNFVFADHVTMH